MIVMQMDNIPCKMFINLCIIELIDGHDRGFESHVPQFLVKAETTMANNSSIKKKPNFSQKKRKHKL